MGDVGRTAPAACGLAPADDRRDDQGRGAAGLVQYGRKSSNGAENGCSHHKSVTATSPYGTTTISAASRRAVRPD